MAIQQLTQPIINPISAFDATRPHNISFVVIGGAQVIANRLVIRDNQTGSEVYNKMQSTMKLEHTIPANTLKNGGYYNAVIYTIDSGNNESTASTAVPFYCYSQPVLTIDNIPATETIRNGTYKFTGSYLQQEDELLNSYQYTLYDSNKDILSQTSLIYYESDTSLSYTFVGMSNDTSYYVELSGETVNGTKITSGLKYFTVRYIQPASFAICDLVNNCENGYIQISSNIVAIDGKSNPTPPIYIDDKEVDLRDPKSWVRWSSGFRIQDDFTMRVWGRDFNEYQNIITLTNDINSSTTPNRIELKWMVGDIIKILPEYTTIEGKSINIVNAEAAKIQNLSIGGNSIKFSGNKIDYGTDKILSLNTPKEVSLQIGVLDNSEQKKRSGKNILENSDNNVSQYGLTATIQDNGSIKVSGTPTIEVAKYLTNVKKVPVELIKEGNYTISFKNSESMNDVSIRLRKYNGTDKVEIANIYLNTINKTDVLNLKSLIDDNTIEIQLDIICYGTREYNFIIYPQLELGSETEYEPFGTSPSLDFPSEIKTVGSNVNLLDISKPKYQSDNTPKIVDKKIICNNNQVWTSIYFVITGLLKNTDYKISSLISKTSGGAFSQIFKGEGIKNENVIKNYNINSNGNQTTTFNTGDYNTITITFCASEANSVFEISNIKLVEGTEVGEYSKYGQGSVKVTKSSKNLFNKNDITSKMYLNNLGETVSNDGQNYSNYITVYSNETYTMHANKPLGIAPAVCFYDEKKNFISGISYNNVYSISFITPANCSYIRMSVSAVNLDSVQLERGDTQTEYEEHKGQSYILPIQKPMIGIGDIRDTFVKMGNKWYERHYCNKYTFTGNETVALQNNRKRIYVNSANNNILKPINPYKQPDKYKQLLCNYAEAVAPGDTWIGIQGISYDINASSGFEGFGISINKFTTVEQYLNWFKEKYNEGQPFYIEYILLEPNDIECTEEQNTILEQLNNSISYIPQTNIYTEDNIAFLNAGYEEEKKHNIFSVGDVKNLINVSNFNVSYDQEYYSSKNTNFKLEPNCIYTFSFEYNVNDTSTDLYYSIGYGTDAYTDDIKSTVQYQSITQGRNEISFIAPENIPEGSYLWVKFVQTIILANVNVDISKVQLERGKNYTSYQDPTLYNIYPISISTNLYDYNSAIYIIKNNCSYKEIQNGYYISPSVENNTSYLSIGIKNILADGENYSITFNKDGNFKAFHLYTTNIGSEEIIQELDIKDNSFIAPSGMYNLQLAFEVDSSSVNNYMEIWNIQIEHGNTSTEYENYISNGSNIVLDNTLKSVEEYRDLICLESPNILNQDTQSGIVTGDTVYYLNQTGNVEYYIWYYNEEGNLIKFIDEEGHEASGIVGIQGGFTTHKDCVKITITKSSDPDASDVTSDELKNNHVSITKGNEAQTYYPYVPNPSLIRYISEIILTGDENWIVSTQNDYYIRFYWDTNLPYSDVPNVVLCSHFIYGNTMTSNCIIPYTKNNHYGMNIVIEKSIAHNVTEFKAWLKSQYNNGEPVRVYYKLATPNIFTLSKDNENALQVLSTYKPISNVFTNNEVLGNIKFDYISDYNEKQTENAYVLLKCWNANNMPYICHSNYIDIPSDKDKVFIWMRRKNNLFDLTIENLGDYKEDDKPIDKNKPIVTMEINQDEVQSTRIPVIAHSLDDNGLRTVRFSKNNGQTWDEVIKVDGLSSTNSYTFINLKPNTTYTIRAEAIDLSGNVGGVSQQITTKT